MIDPLRHNPGAATPAHGNRCFMRGRIKRIERDAVIAKAGQAFKRLALQRLVDQGAPTFEIIVIESCRLHPLAYRACLFAVAASILNLPAAQQKAWRAASA
jgi:hypothetical protein